MAHRELHQLWLSRRKRQDRPRLRLCCLPHAGGGTAAYHRWAASLPSDVEVVPALLPGREFRLREPPVPRLSALTESLAAALAPCLDLPLVLFGHSMGAWLALEIARTLRRTHGVEPAGLCVAASRAPHLGCGWQPLRDLPDDEFLKAIRRFGGVADAVAVHAEFMRLLLPAMRADVAAVETYEYHAEPPLACPLLALAGQTDELAPVRDMDAWRQHTTGHFARHDFPGGHFFVHDPAVGTIAVVRRWLETSLVGS